MPERKVACHSSRLAISSTMWTKLQIFQALVIAITVVFVAATSLLIYEFGFLTLLLTAPLAISGGYAYVLLMRFYRISNQRAAETQIHVQELSHHIAEQERIADRLQKSEEQFRNAFEYAAIGMALAGMGGKLLKVNRTFCDITGYTEAELLAMSITDILHADEIETVEQSLKKLVEGTTRTTHIENRFKHRSERLIWLLGSASLVYQELSAAGQFIFQLHDITTRKTAEQKHAHDALHDALTNLPNRILYMDRLRVAFRRAKRHFNFKFAVLYLDFDRFKSVNDNYGHHIGDLLLIEIARRTEGILRQSDTVARLGGDEFAMLLEDIGDTNEAAQVAERLNHILAQPFMLEKHEVYISLSIGIAAFTHEYEDPEFLLRDADTALYQAKKLGRARYEIFNPVMHKENVQNLQIEADLRRALERDEFLLCFQPIIELSTYRLAGFEALIRWQHKERGLVSPSDFIPLAEDNGMILPIGAWALRAACRQLREWQQNYSFAAQLWVSVNVSGKQFMQPELSDEIVKLLNETGISPHSLKLEITETAMMEDVDAAVVLLEKLKSLGIRLSIDDFGTGYSSLSYLHRFPLDSLKIDRSFVTNMQDSAENREIVRTIINLAQSLKLDIIAEGIENFDQILHLQSLNCQYGQGFYFAKPLDRKNIEIMLGELQNAESDALTPAQIQTHTA